MGRSYKIQCKHCGTEFLQSSDGGYGVMPSCIGCGEAEQQMERAIRCPGCQRRVNTTSEEFYRQVVEEIVWE
ncbi:MAG: hypothetical protein SNG14_03140 [Rikenellaceae bacterium]